MRPHILHVLVPLAVTASLAHAAPRSSAISAQEMAKRIQQAQKAQRQEDKRSETDEKNWQKQALADLNARMSLTPTQKMAAEKILADSAPQIRRLDESPNLSIDDRNARLNTIYANIWEQVTALLTDDQRAAANRRDQADDLVKTLNLSDSQTKQLDISLTQLNKDITKVRADKTLNQDAGNAKVAGLESTMWAKFDSSLSTWQLTQLDNQRAGDMVNAYAEKLKLTDDQRKQILPLAVVAVGNMREIRSKTTLSDTDRDAQVAAAKAEFRAKIRPLLTTAQQKQLDSLVPKKSTQPLPSLGAAASK